MIACALGDSDDPATRSDKRYNTALEDYNATAAAFNSKVADYNDRAANFNSKVLAFRDELADYNSALTTLKDKSAAFKNEVADYDDWVADHNNWASDLESRVSAHNNNPPDPYNAAAVDAYNREADQFNAEKNRLTTEADQITAEKNRLTTESDQIVHEYNRLTAEKNRLSDEADHINTEKSQLDTEKSQLAAEQSHLDQERAQVNQLYHEYQQALHQQVEDLPVAEDMKKDYDPFDTLSEEQFYDKYGSLRYPDEYDGPEYPTHNGFDGDPTIDNHIPAGTQLDRIGKESGGFMADQGTPLAQRSMHPDSILYPKGGFEYHTYEGTGKTFAEADESDWELQYGSAVPAFGQPGGGRQWVVVDYNNLDSEGNPKPVSVEQLLDAGVIR